MASPILEAKIPLERVGVLVGQDGVTKNLLEDLMKVDITVDSMTGNVVLRLRKDEKDPIFLLRAREVVRAIARGFSPERALRLKDEDAILDVIDLRESVGRSQSNLERIKGRIIGRRGKTRSMIEELTEASVSVYGHTISIVGFEPQARAAREAVTMLIRGSEHKSVLLFLERYRSQLKREKMVLWESREGWSEKGKDVRE